MDTTGATMLLTGFEFCEEINPAKSAVYYTMKRGLFYVVTATVEPDGISAFNYIPGIPYLESITVEFDWQGYGLGTQMMQHILSKHPRIYLDCAEDNEVAKALYRKMGFRKTDMVHKDLHTWIKE